MICENIIRVSVGNHDLSWSQICGNTKL